MVAASAAVVGVAAWTAMGCSDDDETQQPPATTATGSGGSAGSGGGTAGSGGAVGGGGTGGTGGTGGLPAAECPDDGLDPTAGTIYYACDCGTDADADCQPGDDSAAGTSEDASWQTYGKARAEFANLSPGDSIAFCRGGAFTVDSSSGNRWVNDQCQAADPCIVRDYPPPWGSGDEDRPIIQAAAGERGFALEDGGNSNHEEGYVFLNLDVRGSGGGNGFFIYNDIDDVLICNVAIDGFDIGVHAAGSNPPEAGSDALNERIVVRLSQITNNPGQGWLGGCNGCAVEYCTFENNGSAQSILNHNIYFSGSSGGVAHDMRAIGNDLYRSAMVSTECEGVSFVVHGEHDGLVIEGNTVREDVGAASPGCWGIAVDTGYGSAEEFRNVVIRGNTVINVGNVAIGTNACENCLIENNVVIQEQAFGTTGIAVPNRARDAGDLPMTGVTIRNNSIYFGANATGRGIVLGDEGTDHVLVSNAVHYAGSNSGFNCFALDLPSSSYTAVDHNLCFFPNASGAEWVDGAGDLAAWQSSSSLDGSSLVADPAFTSLTGPGYDLAPSAATSPLVDAGHPSLSAPDDHAGQSRDAQPDIGAHEW
jgi:hypothetical protein